MSRVILSTVLTSSAVWFSGGFQLQKLVRKQVYRASRLGPGQPGTEWNSEERQNTHAHHFDALRRKSTYFDGEGDGLAKKARKAKTLERVAAYDVGLSVENMLYYHNGQGLVRFEDDFTEDKPADWVPPSLVITMDWEQKQWAMLWFLRNKLNLCLEGIPDVEHLRHKNLENSTDKAGLRPTVQKGIVVFNVAFGSWNKGTWLRDIEETAIDLSRNDSPGSPLLRKWWPLIMKSSQYGPEKDNSSFRARWLAELPTLKTNFLDGPKASSSRWCSYQLAARFHLPHAGTKGYVLSHLALKRKWIHDMDSLEEWSTSSKRRRVEHAARQMGAASSSSAAAVEPKAKAKAKALSVKGKSKLAVDTERRACVNGLRFALETWNDEEWRNDAELLCHITDPEVQEHTDYLTNYKAPEDAMQYFAEMADGRYAIVLAKMVKQLHNVVALERCGFACEPACGDLNLDSPDMLLEDARAHRAVDFLLTYMGERVASCAWHSHACPGITAMFMHKDLSKVTKALGMFKEMVEAWEWASTCGSAEGARMAERSMLCGRLMTAMVRLARLTDFREIHPAQRSTRHSHVARLLADGHERTGEPET